MQVATRAAITESSVDTAQQDGLVFPRGPAGSWDEAGVGSPVVSSCQLAQERPVNAPVHEMKGVTTVRAYWLYPCCDCAEARINPVRQGMPCHSICALHLSFHCLSPAQANPCSQVHASW